MFVDGGVGTFEKEKGGPVSEVSLVLFDLVTAPVTSSLLLPQEPATRSVLHAAPRKQYPRVVGLDEGEVFSHSVEGQTQKYSLALGSRGIF